MLKLLLIAAGGAIGASFRFLTSLAAQKISKRITFLTGTVFVNSIGCLAAGVFTAWMSISNPFGSDITTMLSIGVLGSYTTFSTFSLEVFQRLDKPLRELLSYLFVQLVVAVSLVFAGYSFTMQWFGGAA